MWVGGLLSRAARMAPRVAASRLASWAESIRHESPLPLSVQLPSGERHDLGPAPQVVLVVRDLSAMSTLAHPTLEGFADAYVRGHIDLQGDLREAIRIGDALAERHGKAAHSRPRLRRARHASRQDRRDVRFHYDLGNEFYSLWLDRGMVYSCAYFRDSGNALEQAQADKLEHICRKLRLERGERLLDIGCGWGSLVLHAARFHGVRAVGITLSENQAALARERAQSAGLSDRVQILLLDYRELSQRFGEASFDKIASVGMFEHVGLRNLPAYFTIVQRLLRDRGLFLNHGITSSDVEHRPVGSGAGDFIGRYVFPNGELPHLHLAVQAMSSAGFEVVDVESLRRHYALTLAHWSQRLEARLAQAAALVDEQRLRVWRLYLAGCSHAFERGWINLYQLLGSKQQAAGLTDLPLTREWIYAR